MQKALLTIAFSLMITTLVSGQPNYPKSPQEATLIGVDLKNFIDAYNSLDGGQDTVQILQQQYLDKASPGLKEYIARFGLDAKMLKIAIQKHPKKYAKIEHFYQQLKVLKKDYIKELEAYQKTLEQSMFPPTYLLVADYKGIAQASQFGQLVSVEYKCIEDTEILMHLILHELTHFQQVMRMGFDAYLGVYTKEDNMLDLILREGAADFITYYLVRKNEASFMKLKNYERDESALWAKFKSDLKRQDKDFWLNVSFEDNNKGNPIQLGYALGYKIVKAYYEKAPDKSKALSDILLMKDPESFLRQSGYDPNEVPNKTKEDQ